MYNSKYIAQGCSNFIDYRPTLGTDCRESDNFLNDLSSTKPVSFQRLPIGDPLNYPPLQHFVARSLRRNVVFRHHHHRLLIKSRAPSRNQWRNPPRYSFPPTVRIERRRRGFARCKIWLVQLLNETREISNRTGFSPPGNDGWPRWIAKFEGAARELGSVVVE